MNAYNARRILSRIYAFQTLIANKLFTNKGTRGKIKYCQIFRQLDFVCKHQ